MATTNNSDPLLDEIFSAVKLTPVNFKPTSENKAHSDPQYSQSEDEQNAIRQLDDILQHQNWSNASSVDSEPSEADLPKEKDDSPSSPIHSDEISWSTEAYNPADNAKLMKSFIDNASYTRTRSQTFDSQVSSAESRFGGFDLCDENGNSNDNEINLHHDEVAYHTPAKPKKVTKKYATTAWIEPTVDKQTLIEYQQKLIHAKAHEKKLTEEVHRAQSAVINKEIIFRQTAQNAKKQLNQKSTPMDNYRHSTANNHPQPANTNELKQFSAPVDIYEEEILVSLTLSRQLENAELVEICSEFRYFIPQHKHIKLTNGIDKYIFGGLQPPTDDDKHVLLFGPNGSGKTALVNSMINFLYDVKKEHDIRFCVNSPSQTKSTTGVNIYVFNNTVYPYSITIIDTPGVPNQKGYTGTSSLIRNWFDLELRTSGRLRIDAISVVLRHDEGELGWPLINELAAVKRLLKDDLRTNVMPVTTFGEVLPQPQALRSIVFANIPFISYYKINNCGYMQLAPGQKSLQHNMLYKNAVAELERYFTDLHELVTPLLAVTHHN
uniref:G domain-containing protein n=1 Tax=Panagrolaimus sp. JU765 TaxID=591449 RepID=A0AC34PV15_9BILA